MKLKAFILLFCFCSFLNDNSSFSKTLSSLFRSNQTCNSSAAKDHDHSEPNADGNEESCCVSNPVCAAYLLKNGFSFTASGIPAFKPMAYVVNHYRTSYLSSVWRPPAFV